MALCSFVLLFTSAALPRASATQSKTFEEIGLPNSIGGTAPLSEDGYQLVASLSNNEDMKAFIRRLLSLDELSILDEGALGGFAPYYSGALAVQSLEAMKRELSNVDWVGKKGSASADEAVAFSGSAGSSALGGSETKARSEEAELAPETVRGKDTVVAMQLPASTTVKKAVGARTTLRATAAAKHAEAEQKLREFAAGTSSQKAGTSSQKAATSSQKAGTSSQKAGTSSKKAGTSSKQSRRTGTSTKKWWKRVSEKDQTTALLNFDKAKAGTSSQKAGTSSQKAGTSSKQSRRTGTSTKKWLKRVSEEDQTTALLNVEHAKAKDAGHDGMDSVEIDDRLNEVAAIQRERIRKDSMLSDAKVQALKKQNVEAALVNQKLESDVKALQLGIHVLRLRSEQLKAAQKNLTNQTQALLRHVESQHTVALKIKQDLASSNDDALEEAGSTNDEAVVAKVEADASFLQLTNQLRDGVEWHQAAQGKNVSQSSLQLDHFHAVSSKLPPVFSTFVNNQMDRYIAERRSQSSFLESYQAALERHSALIIEQKALYMKKVQLADQYVAIESTVARQKKLQVQTMAKLADLKQKMHLAAESAQ